MPELPDIVTYVEALQRFVGGRSLVALRLASPFLVRSVDPPLGTIVGAGVAGVERIGKRIVLAFEGDLFLVIHLMIAGRLWWRAAGAKSAGRRALAILEFRDGSLLLTEAGSKRRASLHLVRGRAALAAFDRGGLEVPGSTLEQFSERVHRENHTLKRLLTDPRLFSGVGNAYSDEILHRARLSPLLTTTRLSLEQVRSLHTATEQVLTEWTARQRAETGSGFPGKVTAFREGMAVHGRYGRPCPVCGAPVQRIRYADNETNYCARCQTGGRRLADRSLSRLLKEDWPRTLEEAEG